MTDGLKFVKCLGVTLFVLSACDYAPLRHSQSALATPSASCLAQDAERTTVYVGNLPLAVTADEITAFLLKNLGPEHGAEEINIPVSSLTHEQLGFAHIRFASRLQACRALTSLSGQPFARGTLTVRVGIASLPENDNRKHRF